MSEFDIAIPGARCRVWPDGPLWGGTIAGAIGKLHFDDAASGEAVLRLACERLFSGGRKAVLAPMDGDTWHSYRAVTESDGSPGFALEPVSGPHDVAALRAAGFEGVSEYVSARAPVPLVASDSPKVPGVQVQGWDGQGAEALLDRLFELAGGAFADKLFFKPIERDDFLALYRPLLAMIDPRLVLFAFDGSGEMAGFLFGLPDVAQGSAPDTAILKTYASRKPGVGHLLAHSFHERARELGYAHVVHALMHVDNVSRERSARHAGSVFRRYGLFGRRAE
ncbi:hypothetical protein E5A73_03390 [Sphingomonas gei]|uniref:GNAT family N-acetyltransferase n=1 Tax=Sphingomonas gei TaxID=1395960 RepID=A0A4S1XJ67_9SPHN|nr:hypothetical protein [Sphingomonas gei]TGX56155.1 hypothetical protein E5A73_03390 [Sphingomonas gei]